MKTINFYTGNWQAALRPRAPRVGSFVRIHEAPDAREADDFMRCLRAAGLDLAFVRFMPRLKMDVSMIVRRKF